MRVPTYAPQVTESAAPVAQQNSNVSAAAFGAPIAQGLANVAQVAKQYADDADNLRVQDAYNQLREKQLDLTLGEKTGFTNVKGRDVMSARADGKPLSADYAERFQQVGTEIEGTLANDRQKARFRQKFTESDLDFKGTLMRHETAQISEYAKTVTNATVALETEAALKVWNDPAAIDKSITSITESIQAQGVREGLPADAVKVIVADKVSRVHAGVIAAAADAGNVGYARQRFDTVADQLMADDRQKLAKVLDEGEFEERTQAGAEQVWSEAQGDPTKALQLARTRFKGKDEDAIVTRIKGFDAERVTLRERAQKDAADQGWQYVAQGRAPTASLYAAMDGRDAVAIRRHLAEGPARKTSVAKWLEFTNKTPEQLAAMTPTDLMREYGGHFTDSDIRNANEILLAVKGKNGKPSAEGLQLMTANDLVTRSARELGVLPAKGNPNAEQETAFDTFRSTMQMKVNAWEAANGKKASPEVLQQLLRDEKYNKVKLDVWGSDPERAVISLTDDELGKAYVTVNNRQVKLASIPAEYRQGAIRRLQARNLMVTEEVIAQMWLADQPKK